MAISFPGGGTANGKIMNEGLVHLPIVILLDISGSMMDAMKDLNKALRNLKEGLDADVQCRSRVEICIITFGGTVRVAVPFRSVYEYEALDLTAGGGTPMYAAIATAIEEIQVRRRQYKARGVKSYKPFVFLMTDGHPTDEDNGSFDRLMALQEDEKWNYFPVAVGPDADRDFLMRNNARRFCLTSSMDNFRGVFEFLNDSLSRVSASTPDQATALPAPVTYEMGMEQIVIEA